MIIFLGFPHGHGFSTSGNGGLGSGGFSGAFDCLSSTLSAARKVGFQLVATATIASTRALAVWPWGCLQNPAGLLVGSKTMVLSPIKL